MSNIQTEINRLTQAKTDIKGVLDRLSVSYESDKLDSLALAIGSIKKVEAKQENGVITIPAGYISEEQTFVVSSDLTTGYLINGADGNVYFQAVKEVDGEIVADGDPVKVDGIEIPDTGVDAPSPVYPLPEADIVTGYIINNEDGSVYFQRVKEVDGEITNDGDPVLISEANIPETGVDEPEYVCDSPATSGCEFYKCASVDKVNKTWAGYKAVLTDGVYSFGDTPTEGLSYGDVLLPYIGAIYNRDASIRVGEIVTKIPSIGLLFYAPLNQPSTAADTGQTLNLYGSPVFEIVDGVPCATLDGGTYWEVELDSRISDKFTLSFWSRSDPSASERGLFSTDYPEMLVYLDDSDKLCVYPTTIEKALSEYDKSAWSHCTLSSDGLTVKLYLNGVEKAQGEWTTTPAIQKFYIATRFNYMESQPPWIGHISSFRIYNRALSNSEISGLASEFTPIR